MGVEISGREWAILGVVRPAKKHCVSPAVEAANGMTARMLLPTVMLLIGRRHIALSPVKNQPTALRYFVKII